MNTRIGLLIISTGKYDQFVQPLLDSAAKHFFPEESINIFHFTDKNESLLVPHKFNYTAIKIEHEPWPAPTLKRYEYFMRIERTLWKNTDYLFYIDVDALFIKDIGFEILNNVFEILSDRRSCKLVSVRHCGFAGGGWGSPSVDPNSTAFVPEDKRKIYYMGGFQGGRTNDYLKACLILSKNIKTDEDNGIVAEYHDESHWNHYLSSNTMDFGDYNRLPPTFFMAEEMEGAHEKASILALKKEHESIRS